MAELSDTQAMDGIADLMSGREWDADTLDAIADLVRRTDRDVLDLYETDSGNG